MIPFVPLAPMKYFIRVTTPYGLQRDGHYKFSGVFVKRKDGVNVRGVANAIVRVPIATNIEPSRGQIWEVLGAATYSKVERHNNNGVFITKEYKILEPTRAVCVLSGSLEEFFVFVGENPHFQGITDRTVRKLTAHFDENEILLMLSNGKIQPILDVLTPQKAKAFEQGYKHYENLQYAMKFVEFGIPYKIQQKLFSYYGKDAWKLIESNPYILQTFGLSFDKTDKLALERFKIDEYERCRLNALVEYAMRRHCRKGHTVAKLDELWSYIAEYTGDDDITQEAIKSANSALGFYYNLDTDLAHDTSFFIMEKSAAKRLVFLLKKDESRLFGTNVVQSTVLANAKVPLNTKQKEAISKSLSNRVFVLTGGAGTGKTTVLQSIVEGYKALGFDVFGVAISGRAAKRLHDSIQVETKTIYRFLGMDDEELCVSHKMLLVIDEASMVDIASMWDLLMKLPRESEVRIIFAGDDEQLAPIGVGLVLSELIRSNVIPRTHLDEPHRFANETGIPVYSNEIRNGHVPLKLNYKNISFEQVSLNSKANLISRIVDLYIESDCKAQLIAPTRSIVNEVNTLAQATCNPYGKKVFLSNDSGQLEDTCLRLGDRVIFTKNDYAKGVQNGTLGKIIGLHDRDDKSIIAKVRVDKVDEFDKEEQEVIVNVTAAMLDAIELSYAITLHKAQGSQFNTVICPIVPTPVLERSWVYTAVTRATEYVRFIGSRIVFEKAITSDTKASKRNVYFAELIEKEAFN